MCTMTDNHATPNFSPIHPPEVMLASTLQFWSKCTFVKQVLVTLIQMTPNLVCALTPVYNRAMQNIMPRRAMYSPHHSTNTCCHKMPITKDVPCALLCWTPNYPEL